MVNYGFLIIRCSKYNAIPFNPFATAVSQSTAIQLRLFTPKWGRGFSGEWEVMLHCFCQLVLTKISLKISDISIYKSLFCIPTNSTRTKSIYLMTTQPQQSSYLSDQDLFVLFLSICRIIFVKQCW